MKKAPLDSKPLDFDTGQGTSEEWTEPYIKYGEGVPELATQLSAKRTNKLLGFAQKEVDSIQGVSVRDGFPNPAAESPLQNPDFNKLLIRHPAATYCMRVSGSAWEEQGIFDGDIAIIDRAISCKPHELIVWWEEDSFIINKRLLLPKNCQVWGIVTAIIHQYK
jgi:DNA polymerase V